MSSCTLERHLIKLLLLILPFDISSQSHPNDIKVKACEYYYFSMHGFIH